MNPKPAIVPFEHSYKLLKRSFKDIMKVWAYCFGLSENSMDKMCREPKSDHNPDAYGQRNYLDEAFLSAKCLTEEGRIEEKRDLGRWLAYVHGGFFTPNLEMSGIADDDFCRVINDIMKTMTATIDELRCGYFSDEKAHAFTKEQRAVIHRKVNDVMSAAVTVHEFIRLHKAESK